MMTDLTRRSFVGTPTAIGVATVTAGLPMAGEAAANAVVRFRKASAGGPPYCWRCVKIIDKATGREIPMVTEANADEGWFTAYVDNPDGSMALDLNDRPMMTTVHADIDIVLDHSLLPEGNVYANCIQDIEEGVIYDEDMNDDERSWLANGKPYCQCGRCAMPRAGMRCGLKGCGA